MCIRDRRERGPAESAVVTPLGISDDDPAGIRRSIPRSATNPSSGWRSLNPLLTARIVGVLRQFVLGTMSRDIARGETRIDKRQTGKVREFGVVRHYRRQLNTF